MRASWLLLMAALLLPVLPACGGEVATLPNGTSDQKLLDHFRIVVPAVVESGYDRFEIRIIAENRSGETLCDYQGDWPEAYLFLIVPGWKSFVPTAEGELRSCSWVNGTARLNCHFHRGVFSEESCPIQGYWTLSLQENGPVITNNSYVPWVVETQGRVYW